MEKKRSKWDKMISAYKAKYPERALKEAYTIVGQEIPFVEADLILIGHRDPYCSRIGLMCGLWSAISQLRYIFFNKECTRMYDSVWQIYYYWNVH